MSAFSDFLKNIISDFKKKYALKFVFFCQKKKFNNSFSFEISPSSIVESVVLTKKFMEGQHRIVRYDQMTTLSPSSILGGASEA